MADQLTGAGMGATGSISVRAGKGPGDENFPVASILIAPRLRPHVLAFYGFARAADDLADHPELTPDEKLARLDAFEAGLDGAAGPAEARRLRASLAGTGVSDLHARALLDAFRMDARKTRYRNWDELMGYCALSAHPVGRFLLELHGEGPEAGPASDALCAALQVLNHLQDCGDDLRQLDRVYLPGEWLAEVGIGVEALRAPAAAPGLRAVIDRCLDGCDRLLDAAAPLSGRVRARRLGAEAATIQRLARRLAARLRREDPLAVRVRHRAPDLLAGALAGLGRLLRP